VVVMDGGASSTHGKTATANWLSGLMQSLPGLHEFVAMAGVELPAYLGKMVAHNDELSSQQHIGPAVENHEEAHAS
jgi:flotillin